MPEALSYLVLLGLYSWLAIGAVAGLLAPAVLGGAGRGGAVLTGMLGALVGGLLATALGFGGVAGFDVRSLTTATLVALLFLLVKRLVQVPAR